MSSTSSCPYTRFSKPFTLFGRNGSSYIGTQGGRWNNSITNTKIYITRRVKGEDGLDIITLRTPRLFQNTYNNMSKREIYAYLVNNSNPTNR